MASDVFVPLAAGITMFLIGLKIMEFALHQWAGGWLTRLLETFTRTPLRGLASGTVVTAILQSSSAITVMTIGLVNAGVMSFPQTLGIILGTNIGTCLTTELLGFSLNGFAKPLLALGLFLFLVSLPVTPHRTSRELYRWVYAARCLTLAVAGFARVLLGMNVMTSIVPALKSGGMLHWFVERAQRSLLWGVLAGAALTAVVQSSAAVIGLVMGLAAVDALGVELAIAVTLGANIGTCSTALVAAIGSARAGQFVAWSHMLLNVAGAVLFYPFIGELARLTAWIAEPAAVRIAHAQTLFNVVCSLLALPACYLPFLKNMRSG